MVGYQSKKFLAESRDPDIAFERMDSNLFYNLRHLKQFQKITNNDAIVWAYRWPDNGQIEVYNKKTDETLFLFGHDVQLAEYVCCLHNMSNRLIKEVESKYVS